MHTETLVSIGDAANILGMSTEQLRCRADEGAIPSFRESESSHRRFRPTDLKEWKDETRRERGQARRDPEYEEHRGIRDKVICRVCGDRFGFVSEFHLRCHGLSFDQYKAAYPGAPLHSALVLADVSRKSRKRARSLRGRTRDLVSVRGHAGEKPVRRWGVLKLMREAKDSEEIAKSLGRAPTSIYRITRALGQSRAKHRRPLFVLGSAVTRRRALALYRSTGLDEYSFAENFRVPVRSGYHYVNPRYKSDTRYPAPSHAVRAVDAKAMWNAAFELIRSKTETARKKGGNSHGRVAAASFVRTLLPDCKSILSLLTELIARTRSFLNLHPSATAEQWQDWICNDDGRKNGFARLRMLAAEFSDAISGSEFNALRASKSNWETACKLLADRVGTNASVINHAAFARPLLPRKMEREIQRMRPQQSAIATSAAPAFKRDEKRGHKKGYVFESSNLILQKAKELVVDSRLSFRKAAPIAYGFTRNLNKDERNLLLKRLTALVRRHPDNQPELTAKLLIIRR